MAEGTIKFTKGWVESLPFTSSQTHRITYRDSELPGLILRVGRESKTYYLYKRDGATRKPVRIRLGPHYVLTPQDARLKAMKYLTNEKGLLAAKSDERVATMNALWELFYNEHLLLRVKESTIRGYTWLWNKHLSPRFGDRPPKSLTRREVREFIESSYMSAPGNADKMRVVLSSMLSFALRREYVDFNAAALIAAAPKVKRSNRLDPEDLKPFCEAINTFPPLYRHFYWMVLLLGQRRAEICEMEWAEINRDRTVWVIPGDDKLGLNKGKTKNRLSHAVPLPPLAQAHLNAVSAFSEGQKYVFWSAGEVWNKSGPTYLHKDTVTQFLNNQYKKGLMGEAKKVTIHDLRRTAYTGVTSATGSLELAKRCFNHTVDQGASQHYDWHDYLNEKREALTAWEKRLREYVGEDVVAAAFAT